MKCLFPPYKGMFMYDVPLLYQYYLTMNRDHLDKLVDATAVAGLTEINNNLTMLLAVLDKHKNLINRHIIAYNPRYVEVQCSRFHPFFQDAVAAIWASINKDSKTSLPTKSTQMPEKRI